MKLLSVATFAHPEHFGGAERVISTVAQGLAARGHEVTLLTSGTGQTQAEEMRDGVHVVRYTVDRGSPPTFYRSVWRGVREALQAGVGRGSDVVHLHQVLSAAAAIAPGGLGGMPRLFSFYAPYHLEYLARYREGRDAGGAPWSNRLVGSFMRHADRYLLTRSDEIVVLSDFSTSQIAELAPRAVRKVSVAPAGVDLVRFRPAASDDERRACRRKLGLSDGDEPWLLTVRRLVPRMGISDLLTACAALRARGHGLRLAIAGDGEQRAELEARTRELGLEEQVRFLGRVGDDRLGDLYRASSIFVLPTRSLEGFGMVTAEALASGLPVVATDAGATGEVLGPVPGAKLVPAGDADALAAALEALLADPVAREAAGRAARTEAEGRFTWDRHLDALEQAAERLVSARAR